MAETKMQNVLCKHSVFDTNLNDKRVLLRADIGTTIVDDAIQSDDCILRTFATVKHLLLKCCKYVFIFYTDPEGEYGQFHSLENVVRKFNVLMLDFFGREALFRKNFFSLFDDETFDLPHGSVVFLENMQFTLQERETCPCVDEKEMYFRIEMFHRLMKIHTDIYVNDAFRFAHHVTEKLGQMCYSSRIAGYMLSNELQLLGNIFESPASLILYVLGGNKINDKLKMINHLIESTKDIIVGGFVALVILKVIGNLQVDINISKRRTKSIRNLIKKADKFNVTLHLPVDFIVALENSQFITRTVLEDGVATGNIAVDIADDTILKFSAIILKSRTIVWNGPMGIIDKDFTQGSQWVLAAMLKAKRRYGAKIVAVGEDTTKFIDTLSETEDFSYVSKEHVVQEYLMGSKLPGIEILM